MEPNERKAVIEKHLNALSRAVTSSDYALAYAAYRDLYQLGPQIVPLVAGKLMEMDWKHSRYTELTRYAVALFSLLNDLDEHRANVIFDWMTSDGDCPRHIEAVLRPIRDFTMGSYKRYRCLDVDVFEHEEIERKCNIAVYLQRWLENVPTDDRKGLSRLYVVRQEDMTDASGQYMPILFNISLVWMNPFKADSLLFRVLSLFTEHTLYHEVGHHVGRHTFGIDPQQEREADRYAARITRSSHHRSGWLVHALAKRIARADRNYERWGL